MKKFKTIGFILLTFYLNISSQIKLHPQNPHYFEYKGKPIILIASSEHYGAVINKKFNFEKYLSTLKKIGLNHTRVFLGDYVESKGAFCIETNTLNPEGKDFLPPWKRSNVKGYSLGGNKFDLDKWSESYFKRLHKFMSVADKYDIIVEAVLFFASWTLENSPLYFKNNINGTDSIAANKYMTLTNGNVLKRQKDYCLKLVTELNKYDNIIFNVANEPWFDNQEHPGFVSVPPKATKQWIKQVTEWIIETERFLPKKHIISVDYTNEGLTISEKDMKNYYKNISVFNHHYDRNAESVKLNYSRVNKALSFNETGLMPISTPQYRIQGWKYIFSGGALYNNLDFTFQVGNEDGTGNSNFTCEWYSGCSDSNVKFQLANLLKYFSTLPFIKMKPDYSVVGVNYGDENIFPLVQKDKMYAIYFEGGNKAKIQLNIINGDWNVEWINPSDLKLISKEKIKIKNNHLNVLGPNYKEDVLLFIYK